MDVSAERALFLIRNFIRATWDIKVGAHRLQVPGYAPGQGFGAATLVLEAGPYLWYARSDVEGGYERSDPDGLRNLDFSVNAGEVYFAKVLSLSPATSAFH